MDKKELPVKYDVAAVDVGNTNTTVGYYTDNELKTVKSRKTCTVKRSFYVRRVRRIVVSSVVPEVTRMIKKKYPKARFIKLKDLDIKGLPKTIGLDRAINMHTAAKLYAKNVTVIDFGTAITVSSVKEKEFKGGLIMPGVDMMQDSLHQKTAQLPKVAKMAYARRTRTTVFAKTPEAAINNGVFYLISEGIKGIIRHIKGRLGDDQLIVATGGYSMKFGREIEDVKVVNPTLLLDGLNDLGTVSKK